MHRILAISGLVAALAGCASSSSSPMTTTTASPAPTEANKLVVRRFYAEYLNRQRSELLPSLFSSAFVDHTNGGRGPAAVAAGAGRLRAAFENLHFELLDLIAEGDVVAARWVYTGRHVAPFAGRPPTGKPHEQNGLNFFRVRDGKIAELWLAVDPTALRPLPDSGTAPTAPTAPTANPATAR